MENEPEQNVQGPLPAPARAPLRRLVTSEEQFQAYQYKNVKRVGIPLPKKVPKIEAKEFKFDKVRDATGSILGDVLKRIIYQDQDLIGDKRREIYLLLPMNDSNKKQIKLLGSQLNDMGYKLRKKLQEFKEAVDITLEFPEHFKEFPALED